MKVQIEFYTDNAAFEDDYSGQVELMLDQAHTKLVNHGKDLTDTKFEVLGRLRDVNGNSVGTVVMRDELPQ